jgi:hypothetical protein
MAETNKHEQIAMFETEPEPEEKTLAKKITRKKMNGYEPPNLGKAIRLPVPDFSDPDRPPVCLDVDFPIPPAAFAQS